MTVAAIDWTSVLVYGLPAYIAAVGAAVAAIMGASNRQQLRTPSGEKIGDAVDRTLGLAGVTVAHTTALVKASNGTIANGDQLERLGEHASQTMGKHPADIEGGR